MTRRRIARRWGRRSSAFLLVAGFVLAGAGAALAFWTVSTLYAPTNYALAHSASLSAPSAPTATVNGSGSVTVGWTLPGAQLAGAQYKVTRTSGPGSPATVCTVASTATSCSDTGLSAAATYGYSVMAVLSNWQSAAITASATTATPTLTITLSTGPYAAGTPITVTQIQAKVGGTVDTTYTGAKTIDWTGLANSPSAQAPAYPSGSVTFTSGVASPGTTVTAYAAGSSTLTATDHNATGVQGSVTFTLNPATKSTLAITTQPASSITAGGTVSVGVTVRDQYGNPITTGNPGATDSLHVALSTGSFASGTTTMTAANGTVTFTALQITTSAGSPYTITATDATTPAVTQATTNPVTVSGGAATKFVITSAAVSGPASSTAGLGPITVAEQDSFGNPTTTAETVTLASNSTGTTVFSASLNGTATTTVTIPGGSSSTTFFYGDTKAGSPTVTASGALTSATQVETITAAAANKFVITSTAVSGVVTSTAGLGPITVAEQDSFGNPTTTAETVGLTSSSTGGVVFSATLNGTATTTVTIPGGSSSTTFFYGDTKAGSPTITAAGALTSATQAETLTAGSPNRFALSGAVTGPVSSTAGLGPITVAEQDSFGNPTTTAETVTLASNSTGTAVFSATLNGTTTSTVSIPGGSSSTTFFYGDTKAGSPTVTASGALTSATQVETITAAPATKFVITSTAVSGPASATAGLGPITVAEQDSFGNPTTTAETVNLTSSSTGGVVFSASLNGSSTTTVSIPGGSSSTTFFYGDTKAGSPTVTASGALTSATQVETITAGAAAKLAITSTAVSGAASSSATLGPITVAEQDSLGNPVNAGAGGESVTLSSDSTGAVFAATSGGSAVGSVTIPSASSSTTFFYGDTKAGTPTITVAHAAAPALASGTQAETITAAAGTKLVITTTAFSATAASSATTAFTTTLQDNLGNTTTSASAITVNLASTSSGKVFAATSGGTSVSTVTLPATTSAVTAFYGDTVAGSPTITVSGSGLTSGTQVETITAAAASKFVLSGAVSGPVSASANVGPIQVAEQDSFNNLTTTAETVSLTSSSSGGVVFSTSLNGSSTTTVSIPGGSSSTTFFYGDTLAGSPTITASGALTSATQVETITATAGTKLVITSNAFSVTAGTTAAAAFTTTLQDNLGNPTTSASPITVNLASTSAGKKFAAISGGTSVTTVTLPANNASVTAFYADTVAGSPTITVSGAGLSPNGTQAETVTAAAANKFVITSTAVSGPPSATASLGPITVAEQDTFGNPTTTAETVNLASNSTGTAVFSATQNGGPVTTVAIPGGSSSTTFFYGDTKPGSPTVTASGALTSATQVETITAGTAAKLVITSTAVSGPASSSATLGPITVQEQDSLGNPVNAGVGGESVTLSSNTTGTAVFSAISGGGSTTSVTIPNGSSSTTFFYGDSKVGTPTITVAHAAVPALTSGTQAETITAATGAKLVITSSAFSATAGNSATTAFTTTLEDNLGNPTTSGSAITVNLASSSAGKKFAATSGGTSVSTVTLPANTASVTAFYADTVAGSPTITVSGSGLSPNGTQAETVTAAPANKFVITSTAVSGAASTTASLGPITVAEQDTFGNATTTAETVALASNSTGTAVFSPTVNGTPVTSVSIPGGSSSTTFFYGDTKPGSPTITASGALTSATQLETITAGAGVKLVITSSAFSVPVNSSATTSFTTTLQDSSGNPTTSAAAITVNLASTSAGKMFAATSGGASVSTVTLPATTPSVTAFYGDSVAGTPTITVSGSSLTSGTQTETITAVVMAASQMGTNSLTNNKSSLTTSSFTAPAGTPALVFVTYEDGGSQTCSSIATATGTPLNSFSGVLDSNVWWTGAANYGMCAFTAKGTGTAGTVTVTLSGNTQNISIQVIDIAGDNNATFGVNNFGFGSSTNALVTLAGLTPGSSEMFLGDAATGGAVPTWTGPAGYTHVGTTQVIGSPAFSAPVYFGTSAASETGSLNPTAHWGTIGIEIKP